MDTLVGVIDWAGRGSVHAQERNAAVRQVLGSLRGQTGKILKIKRGSVVGVPARSYENPCTRTEHVTMGLKLLSRDPFFSLFAREIEDHSFADQGFKRNPVESHPAADDMRRSIQMRSQVVAEANRLNRIPIPLQALNLSELRP